MAYTIEELERIMSDGFADVECPECGEYQRLEPDGSYPYPETDCSGRVVSPLIEAGLI